MMLMNQGMAALMAGHLDESKLRRAEGLRIAHQIDDRVAQTYLLGALACRAAASSEPRLAAHSGAPFPFAIREYIRLLLVRRRVQAGEFATDDLHAARASTGVDGARPRAQSVGASQLWRLVVREY
jgi:hypothetical protein